MGVSNILIWFLLQLSEIFAEVDVYVAPGNHSRLLPQKEENLKGENLDHLLMFCLKGYLQNVDNLFFHDNDLEEGIAKFDINGFHCYAAHGDKDKVENICQHITDMTKQVPDYCLLGHKHFNSMTTINGGCKVIQTGSTSGPDEYCSDNRLQGRPEQMVAIFDLYGLNCLYDIDLR